MTVYSPIGKGHSRTAVTGSERRREGNVGLATYKKQTEGTATPTVPGGPPSEALTCTVPLGASVSAAVAFAAIAAASAVQFALYALRGSALSASAFAALASVGLLLVLMDMVLSGGLTLWRSTHMIRADANGLRGRFRPSSAYAASNGVYRVRSPILRVSIGNFLAPNLVSWVGLVVRLEGERSGRYSHRGRVAFFGRQRGSLGNQLVLGRTWLFIRSDQVGGFGILALKGGAHIHVRRRWTPGWMGDARPCPLRPANASRDRDDICLPPEATPSEVEKWMGISQPIAGKGGGEN